MVSPYETCGEFPEEEDEIENEEDVPLLATGQYQCAFRDVIVDFPYDPYESQIQMMEKIIDGVSEAQNCLLESPTGTGKTAALLCALLAWQRRIKPVVSVPSPGPSRESEQEACCCKFDVFPGASIQHILSESGTQQVRREEVYDESPSGCLGSKPVTPQKRRLVLTAEAETRTKDQLCPACVEKYFPTETQEPQSNPDRMPTIYYATRTHSQIKQVIAQLQQTVYAHVNMTLLSSRKQSCCNVDALKEDSVDDACQTMVRNYIRKHNNVEYDDDECETSRNTVSSDDERSTNDESEHAERTSGPNPKRNSSKSNLALKTCEYYQLSKDVRRSQYGGFVEERRMEAWDVEDIVKFGKSSGTCPYFGAKSLHENADIVFCSYNYLLYPYIRNASSIKLENSVLVFDEAHNIEQICRDVASITINETRMREDIVKKVEKLMWKIARGKPYTNGLDKVLERWSVHLSRLSTWILDTAQKINLTGSQEEASLTLESKVLLESLDKLGLGTKDLEKLKEDVKILGKHDTEPKVDREAREFIERLVYVLSLIYREDAKNVPDYAYVLIRRRGKPGRANQPRDDKYEFRVICMNPAIPFRKLKHNARSIIVASGTLSPTNSFESELETPFHHKLSAKHVVESSQVWAGILTHPVSGTLRDIELTAMKQGLEEVQDWLGQTVLQYCRTIPFGVLVFLPSYKFLNVLKARWNRFPEGNPLIRQLGLTKEIFYEEAGCSVTQFKTQMDTFKTRIIESPNGCLLFAIFRGKVSEGVDFKDEQARAVITVGIPNLPFKDPTIESKMKYNDMKCRQPNSNYLSGKEWYDCQAFRAINQAFGRCIRHRHDWGALILLDSRLARPSEKAKLSMWVQDFLKTFNQPALLNQSLVSFIKHRIREQNNMIEQ